MKSLYNRLIYIVLIFFACVSVHAQEFVTTKVEQRAVNGHEDLIDIVFTFTMQDNWHVYGPENTGGPTPMTITFEALEGAQAEDSLRVSPTPTHIHDPLFDCEVTFVEKQATAIQRLRLTDSAWKVCLSRRSSSEVTTNISITNSPGRLIFFEPAIFS